ncbi:hypothetical protein TSAR_015941 [Trichomalopsis sarcophagae]|uniref:Uncharacterized protein n=1 Tax=Trichomalopsis sarcophagae TaxID=543379 RepID=A0A232EP12_9HYME|nr:hypothetical protein TSAR_015941 [Trichomalopsis sarcophagae]
MNQIGGSFGIVNSNTMEEVDSVINFWLEFVSRTAYKERDTLLRIELEEVIFKLNQEKKFITRICQRDLDIAIQKVFSEKAEAKSKQLEI